MDLIKMHEMQETLDRAKTTVAVIEQTRQQIQKYKELKKHKEILICPNNSIASKALKSVSFSDGIAPTYYTGKTKNKVIDILIEEQTRFLESREKELAKM